MEINKGLLVLAVIIFSVAVAGCGVIQKDPEAEKNAVVAKVNGHVITKEEFDRELDYYKNSFELQFGSDVWNQDIDGKKFIDVVKEQVIETLIYNELVLEEAQRQGIEVTQQETDQEIQAVKDLYEDEQQYQQLLETQGLSEEQFAEKIELGLIESKFREKVLVDVTVSEEEIKDYYDKNQKEFKNDTIKASHILLDTREEAEEVLAKAKTGENFAELAKKYSVEPDAETSGGDLGEFGYGAMVEPFEQAAFALDKGEISDIVETQFGYHIIKVFDKTIVDVTSFEEVRDQIENNLLYDKQKVKYNQILTELREQAEIDTYPRNM